METTGNKGNDDRDIKVYQCKKVQGNEVEVVEARVFREENISLCERDENSIRQILITDIIKCMEENPKYKNSKLLRLTLAQSIKYS